MYRYDEFDAAFVKERTAQFTDQVMRRVRGEINEDRFRPLRLMNGLYLQLHAYMFRIAIPYSTLRSKQLRKLAFLARTYDRGYGHFTTRTNIQFNWPRLSDVPKMIEHLNEVEMHSIQTSGNCIRNISTDQFAGAAADEIIDPRPMAEILRQWSSLHPEFSYLPRKFKFAMTGSPNDRAAIKFHDIGMKAVTNPAGEIGWEIWVGGGLGRSPFLAKTVREFLPKADLLPYLEAILRTYNLLGRRDNKWKARIKILVHETGIDRLREEVEAEYAQMKGGVLTLPQAELDRIRAYFAEPPFEWCRDARGHSRRVGARARDVDPNRRELHRRHARDGQKHVGHGAGKEDADSEKGCPDRPFNKDARDVHGVTRPLLRSRGAAVAPRLHRRPAEWLAAAGRPVCP